MKYIELLGRILYSLIFVTSGLSHFTSGSVEYAGSKNVPMASVLVPLSGIMAILGGLSIMAGFKAKWGAWLLVAFLVPVSFMMHDFWNIADPMQRQIQTAMFMKNISMLGAALIITWFGAGPISVDRRNKIL